MLAQICKPLLAFTKTSNSLIFEYVTHIHHNCVLNYAVSCSIWYNKQQMKISNFRTFELSKYKKGEKSEEKTYFFFVTSRKLLVFLLSHFNDCTMKKNMIELLLKKLKNLEAGKDIIYFSK